MSNEYVKCSKCGAEIKQSAFYCPRCGANFLDFEIKRAGGNIEFYTTVSMSHGRNAHRHGWINGISSVNSVKIYGVEFYVKNNEVYMRPEQSDVEGDKIEVGFDDPQYLVIAPPYLYVFGNKNIRRLSIVELLSGNIPPAPHTNLVNANIGMNISPYGSPTVLIKDGSSPRLLYLNGNSDGIVIHDAFSGNDVMERVIRKGCEIKSFCAGAQYIYVLTVCEGGIYKVFSLNGDGKVDNVAHEPLNIAGGGYCYVNGGNLIISDGAGYQVSYTIGDGVVPWNKQTFLP